MTRMPKATIIFMALTIILPVLLSLPSPWYSENLEAAPEPDIIQTAAMKRMSGKVTPMAPVPFVPSLYLSYEHLVHDVVYRGQNRREREPGYECGFFGVRQIDFLFRFPHISFHAMQADTIPIIMKLASG